MKLTAIAAGTFKLDGGAMFGVVPRRLWAAMNPPDANNLCTWALRALLVQTGDRNILIDTGIGNKQDSKFHAHFEPQGAEMLFESLRKAGLDRSDITDVFLTHLHFDHCGGALWKNEQTGAVDIAFPKASYWSNERHFNWAMQPNERERASFLKENFLPLLEQKRLKFLPVRQNHSFAPGMRIRFFNGHTEAMMAPLIQCGGRELLYCADAMPSQWHIGMPYVMAYDIRPLQTLREKQQMLETALRRRQILFFEHDPVAECGTLRQTDNGRITIDEVGKLADLLG
jgi:glyoxylase-like metal-dependent hydrolase (beta-lactamase superfamily II)